MRDQKLVIRSSHRVLVSTVLAAFLVAGLLLLLNDPIVAQSEPPPSLVVIQRAYERGELDYETALIYKVHTVFAPQRLPPRFRSPTPSRGATLILAEVHRNWDSLSPSTRSVLREFVGAPPADGMVGPLAQTRPTLTETQTYTTDHFVIHYTVTGTDAVYAPEVDANPANGVPDYVDWVAEDAEAVWAAEIATMGWLEPPPDGVEGGSSKYDVYLKNIPPYYGYTDFVGGRVGDNPNSPGVTESDAYYSYIVLENDFRAYPGDRRDNIRVTLAHEFNHAIQVGYDGTEAMWLMEATATWMEDEVYDAVDDNYQFLDQWFTYPDIALDVPDGQASAYGYGRWIFMRYVSEHHGGQSTVRGMWEHAVTADSVDAVDAGLTGVGSSFDEVFPRFILANYVLSSSLPCAPYTYEEADGYRDEVGSVEFEAFLPFDGTSVTYRSYTDGNDRYLERHSAEYWVVSTTTSLEVVFDGNSGIDYAVYGALRQGRRLTIKDVELTSQEGTLVVYDPAAYDEVVVVVANVGNTHDDDEQDGYSLTFQPTSETPPEAVVTSDLISVSILAPFHFDASASSDTQTPGNQLEVRWDWEGDYVWDTDWSVSKTASHSYTRPGVYTPTVEVRDGVDLRDIDTCTVTVEGLGYEVFLPLVLSSFGSSP